jgi:hypothetical protein
MQLERDIASWLRQPADLADLADDPDEEPTAGESAAEPAPLGKN